jgi:hypothetical protein
MSDLLQKLIGIEMIQRIETELPRITERKVSLNQTGVDTRNFHHWKISEIVPKFETENADKRSWVRLNLYDFVWVMIIKTAREFGVPIPILKEMKEMFYKNALQELIEDKEELFDYLKKNQVIADDQIEALKGLIMTLDNEQYDIDETDFYLITLLGMTVNEVLFKGSTLAVVFYKKNDEFIYDVLENGKTAKLNEEDSILNYPHLVIPILPLISDFFEEEKNMPVMEYWGFINKHEKRVIEALRKNDFKEIVIKKRKDGTLVIEGTEEKDVMDEKAKELRRILGLKEYDEITVKYRNDKHIYVKNTKRL